MGPPHGGPSANEAFPMSLHDSRGIPVSARDAQQLARLEHATELSIRYSVDLMAAIDAALTEDADFAPVHCLRAGIAVMSTERAARPLLEQSLSTLERLGPKLNARERAHAGAARSWL